MTEFFAMGGYAVFVWGSYGVATIALVGMVALSVLKLKSATRTAAALDAARKARRLRSGTQPSPGVQAEPARAAAPSAPVMEDVRP